MFVDGFRFVARIGENGQVARFDLSIQHLEIQCRGLNSSTKIQNSHV